MTLRRPTRIARVLCPRLPNPQQPVLIHEEEASHLAQVLRLRNGDPVLALDGCGSEVTAQMLYQGKALWLETQAAQPTRQIALEAETAGLVLEVAILKADAMSWVIEKAVELGVNQLIPVECDYGVVEVGKKGTQHFVERWQRIADQALKQCERLHRMQVSPPVALAQALQLKVDHRWVAVEPSAGFTESSRLNPTQPFARPTHVMIGPEGGWSPAECAAFRAEMQMGRLKSAHLGPLVLRAETAALFVMSCALAART